MEVELLIVFFLAWFFFFFHCYLCLIHCYSLTTARTWLNLMGEQFRSHTCFPHVYFNFRVKACVKALWFLLSFFLYMICMHAYLHRCFMHVYTCIIRAHCLNAYFNIDIVSYFFLLLLNKNVLQFPTGCHTSEWDGADGRCKSQSHGLE